MVSSCWVTRNSCSCNSIVRSRTVGEILVTEGKEIRGEIEISGEENGCTTVCERVWIGTRRISMIWLRGGAYSTWRGCIVKNEDEEVSLVISESLVCGGSGVVVRVDIGVMVSRFGDIRTEAYVEIQWLLLLIGIEANEILLERGDGALLATNVLSMAGWCKR